MPQLIRVCGPKDKPRWGIELGNLIIDVTSKSQTWTREFSPFFLGPVKLPNGEVSNNVENAWQFSKVYPTHVDEAGNPDDNYWRWAKVGWKDARAHRYPMGKGAKPLYSLWGKERFGYIEARQIIYAPIYEQAVRDSGYFEAFVEFCRDCIQDNLQIYLFDFDGYDNTLLNWSFDEVMLNPSRKMGHGFVLARMVCEELSKTEEEK